MSFSPLIRQMIEALRGLPGVGPKTAQRMALHLLERDRAAAAHLSKALDQAIAGVGYCRRCRTLSETELCEICTDERRDASLQLLPKEKVNGSRLAYTHSSISGNTKSSRNNVV